MEKTIFLLQLEIVQDVEVVKDIIHGDFYSHLKRG